MDINFVIFPYAKWEILYKDNKRVVDRCAEHGYIIKAILDELLIPYKLYKITNPHTLVMEYFNYLDNPELVETKENI